MKGGASTHSHFYVNSPSSPSQIKPMLWMMPSCLSTRTVTHLVLGQELCKVFLPWLLKYGQVAPAANRHEMTNRWIHATGSAKFPTDSAASGVLSTVHPTTVTSGRKRVHNLHGMPGSPVDDVEAESSAFLHHVSEMVVKFRGSSGDVQSLHRWAVLDDLDWHTMETLSNLGCIDGAKIPTCCNVVVCPSVSTNQRIALTSMHRSATSLLTISFRWGDDST